MLQTLEASNEPREIGTFNRLKDVADYIADHEGFTSEGRILLYDKLCEARRKIEKYATMAAIHGEVFRCETNDFFVKGNEMRGYRLMISAKKTAEVVEMPQLLLKSA